MMKSLIVGLWCAGVALGASHGWTCWEARRAAAALEKPPAPVEMRKARPITVPVVQDGDIQGYVVIQLAYMVDSAAIKKAPFDPEPYLLDEAFRHVYADASLDFRRLEKYDVDRLKRALDQKVAARLKSDVVREVLVHEFNYVAKSDLR
ncbi:MAG: hypothetical protein JNK46_00220 [Methylobacteriaceae bacterium]|nr:hypothetical protein [Methylobacteriaceae bacterium]